MWTILWKVGTVQRVGRRWGRWVRRALGTGEAAAGACGRGVRGRGPPVPDVLPAGEAGPTPDDEGGGHPGCTMTPPGARLCVTAPARETADPDRDVRISAPAASRRLYEAGPGLSASF